MLRTLLPSAPALVLTACGLLAASSGATAQVLAPPTSVAAWSAPVANGATLRVVSETSRDLTLEVTAQWSTPLAEVLAASEGAPDRLALMGAAGRPALTYLLDLGAGAGAVEVLAEDAESVPLSPEGARTLSVLAPPVATIVDEGEHRRQRVGTLVLPVLRVVDGRLQRTRRLLVRVQKPGVQARVAGQGSANPHVAVTRSALADGRWFRIPVAREGVYRLTRAYLRDSLGVDVAPSAVAVYGNGGRILPAVNAAPRPADLREVPSLLAGDDLLFFAEGPSWWDWDPATAGGVWRHGISPFADTTAYFVRVDAATPARLTAEAFPAWPDAERVAQIQDRYFYEVDRDNYPRDGSGSGLDWMGPEVLRSGSGLTVLGDVQPPGMTAATVVRYRARVFARANPRVTVTLSSGGADLASVSPLATSLSGSNAGNLLHAAEVGATRTGAGPLGVTFRTAGGDAAATTWLDWLEAVVERPALTGTDGFLRFATPGGRAGRFEFALEGFAAQPEVWDVTESGAIRRLGVRAEAGRYLVQVEVEDAARPREIVAFLPGGGHPTLPRKGTAVPNQNLHGVGATPDYVVVAHPDFLEQAQRLADYRAARDGFSTLVVTIEQVYNEFSGGTVDMRAVRDFMKFLYDRDPNRLPSYLLLFGDGHFDYRNIGTEVVNFIPPFETENMINRTDSYTSDDYFGLLGDTEGRWAINDTSERVDIGIGRIPARTDADARAVVDKIIAYEDPASFGPWRSTVTFVADDQFPNSWDTDVHVLNSNVPADNAQASDPSLTVQKVYAPSYPAVTSARGLRRPQAVDAIVRSLNEGTLLWSYSGHGGPTGLGDEKYFDTDVLNALDNDGRPAIFITATCSFGKFDIENEQSLAEEVLLRERGGGVAMLTTVRIVYTGTNPDSGTNFGLNVELTDQLVRREPDGRPVRLGDALRRTKNTTFGASANNRKFNLLGDPAMRIGLPEQRVAVAAPPTLRAFDEATVSGSVLGLNGQPDAAFNGEVDLAVFDALRVVEMPQVTPGNQPCCNTGGRYTVRTDRIYAGRATVVGGQFSATFRVPQDISYSGAPARVAAYVRSAAGAHGAGASLEPLVSAQVGARPDDGTGPEIRLFVDDTTFVSGGLVRRDPTLIARLGDASGINTVGAGVGHELLLTLNGDAATAVDIGRYYLGDLDTYRSGTIRYPLPRLAPGPHEVELTAWDAVNNAGSATLRFVVTDAPGLDVRNVFPYPNPTAGPTRFTFEHNQPPGTAARVQLRVYTLAGRPIRTIDGDEALPGGVLPGGLVQIPWDGRDDDLDRLASGVYLFRLRVDVDAADGTTQVAERVERLAIIR